MASDSIVRNSFHSNLIKIALKYEERMAAPPNVGEATCNAVLDITTEFVFLYLIGLTPTYSLIRLSLRDT